MIIDILVKLQENTPLRHTIIRNSLALLPNNMVHKSDNCSIRFRELADKLYGLNKITAETSDNSKTQFDDLLKIAKYEHREAFVKFDYKKHCLDDIIWPFLMRLSDNKELSTMCKVIFVLSHGQSFTERGFSIDKEVVGDNMKGRHLISQRIVYDTLQSCYDGKVLDFQVTSELKKACRLAHQKYKPELENTRVAKKEDNVNRKRKLKQEEIQNIKKQKLNVEDAINALRESVSCEILAADQEQNLTRVSKVAAFIRMISEKEKTLRELTDAEKQLEK